MKTDFPARVIFFNKHAFTQISNIQQNTKTSHLNGVTVYFNLFFLDNESVFYHFRMLEMLT